MRSADLLCAILLAGLSFAAASAPPAGTLVNRLEIAPTARPGDGFDIAALRGRPAVLYVWGEWCIACERSTPEMLALAERHPEAQFVFINTDHPARPLRGARPANVMDMQVDQQHFGAATLRKKDFRFADLGLVFGVPAYYLIDAGGRIALTGNGGRFVSTVGDGLRGLPAK